MALSRFDRALWRSTRQLYLLSRRAFVRTKDAALDPAANVERILLIRTDKIGDAIISTAFFKALRDRFPNAQIDIVLGRKNGTAAPLLPHLDGVFVAKKNLIEQVRLIRQLRERRYDIAIDMLTGDSMTAASYTALSGARINIGFDGKAAGFYDIAVARPSEPEHQGVQMLRLIASLGVEVKPEDIRPAVTFPQSAAEGIRKKLGLTGRDGTKLLVINLSVAAAKYWTDENFIRLIGDLKSPSVRVVLAGAPWDLARMETIGKTAEAEWLEPSSDLSTMAAALSCADLVISPDTSIVHIAAALNKPVVTLMASYTANGEWYPFGVPYRALHCATRVADIPYDEVLVAVRELMAELDGTKQAPSTDRVLS
jgi:ADP-heptose:LPS heptosyltransferase